VFFSKNYWRNNKEQRQEEGTCIDAQPKNYKAAVKTQAKNYYFLR